MAVFGVENAARIVYAGLFAQQHRGQESAGIVTTESGRLYAHKGSGLVQVRFDAVSLDSLPGTAGIGHVRYSTCGGSHPRNAQPLVADCAGGPWAIAHNGNLTNAARLKEACQEDGAIFQTATDSEVLLHLLAAPRCRHSGQPVVQSLEQLQGAFSVVLLRSDAVIAARDALGFKPLVMGQLGRGYVFASETCALQQVGAEFLREVAPGEIVTVDANGLTRRRFGGTAGPSAQCVFEMIYFARPDSNVFGYNVHGVRVRHGMRLAEEHPVPADVVVPIPDSGMSAAIGYARASGIPLDMGFIRNHYVGRTFIQPQNIARQTTADFKLAIVKETVAGRRVVVVDDSIVRGNTIRGRVALLRRCGATEVHVRVASPPIRYPCRFGVDFPVADELLAAERGVEALREWIGADSLGYLSEAGLLSPFENGAETFCRACINGAYPPASGRFDGKLSLEGRIVETVGETGRT